MSPKQSEIDSFGLSGGGGGICWTFFQLLQYAFLQTVKQVASTVVCKHPVYEARTASFTTNEQQSVSLFLCPANGI